MPNDKYFGLKYEILFAGGSWRDVTSHVDSRQTKITLLGCTSDLKGGISTMDVELRYGQPKDSRASHSSLVGQLLQAKADGDTVLFRATGLTEFVGRVDMSNFSQTNSVIPGFLSMTVEDMSYLLDEKMETFEYPPNADLNDIGYVVFDPALPHISVVTQRLIAAGYELTDIDTDASDVIGERVRRVVSGDDDRTYRDFLNTLLYEYCAVLYCNGEGKFVIRRLYQESPVAGREITEFLAADGISTKGGDYQADGEEVVWSTLSVGKNAVYVANISVEYDETGPIKGEEVLPHHYWPKDGDIEETWQEFSATFLDRPYLTEQSRKQNKDLSIVSVKNVEVSKSFDVPNDFVLANNPPEIEPRRARFLYYNKSDTETRNVFGFAIEGNVLYRSKLNETLFPPTAKKPSPKYETEFVYDAISAERLANHLYRFRKNGDLSHTWAEMSTTPFPLFEVVNVAAPDTHISTLGLVLSQDITFPAPKKVRTTFTSVSITAFNSEPARVRSVVLGKVNVEPGRDGQSGDKQIVQYALGDEDAPYSDESILLGADDTLVGTNMALVGVDKSQVWQDSPPTPAKGQYVWRREGWYTPPSVWPNVWNIVRLTGIQGEDAEKIELRKSPENIVTTARGWMKQRYITVQAILYNIEGTITWSCSDGTLTPVELEPGVYDNTKVILDGATVVAPSTIVTASLTYEGTAFTTELSVDKIVTGDTKAHNFGGFGSTYDDDGSLNPVELPDGDLLTGGDYFMWVHDTVNKGHSTDERLKGEIYEYTGSEWRPSTNGDLVMTMFDTFAELENDYDSAVLGYAVIKKLVAIDAFIKNLKVENIVAGLGDGTASSGFRFRAMTDSAMDGTNVPVFDVIYNERKVFEINPVTGSVMFGNYDPITKSGGILYDYANDKLLGNVAYDQWDLVIESDADLALLTTGTTEYKNVLIAPGTHNATAPIDLDAHGVVVFVGSDRGNSILNVGFCISHTKKNGYFLKIGQATKEMGNFTIVSDTVQYDTTVNVDNDIDIIYCPLYDTYPTTSIHDITIDSLMFAYENTGGGSASPTRTTAMRGPYVSSPFFEGLRVGFDGSITNCRFANLWFGMRYFSNISNCIFSSIANNISSCIDVSSCIIHGSSVSTAGISNSYSVSTCAVYNVSGQGFSSCISIAGCRAISNRQTGSGFSGCFDVTGCHAVGYNYGFYSCMGLSACSSDVANTYDFISCSNISSSFSYQKPPRWHECTKVDTDSCTNS